MIKKILLGIMVVTVGLIIYMKVPFSPLKKEYEKKIKSLSHGGSKSGGRFLQEDFETLPEPLREYFIRGGFIGKDKVEEVKMSFKEVDFMLSKEKPSLKIDYTLYDFSGGMDRVAFIDTSLFGIPFQGLDEYIDGSGGMKGVLGKHFTLFDEKGDGMDSAGLITYLAESIMHPSLCLREEISFYPMDDYSVRAVIESNGITQEGIFSFDENYRLTMFKGKRYNSDRENYEDWEAGFSGYKEKDGLFLPRNMSAKWIIDGEELLYFQGENMDIEFK